MAFGVVVVPKVLRLLLVAVCSVHKPCGQGSSLLRLRHRTGGRLCCLQSRLQAGLGCRQGSKPVCPPPAVVDRSQQGAHCICLHKWHAAPRRPKAHKHTMVASATTVHTT